MSGPAALRPGVAPASAYDWARVCPGRPAFIDAEGATTTFGELGDRVNRLSNALGALDIRAGDRVALQLGNCREYLEVALATGQIGVILVPLSTHLSPAETQYILADSQGRALVAGLPHARELAGADAVRGLARLVIGGELPGWHGLEAVLDASPAARPEQRLAGNNMGYTSGTSGRPKGVLRQPRPVTPEEALGVGPLRFLALFGLAPGDGRHLVCSPLYHAAPFAFAQGALHLGHTLVCLPKFDAGSVLESIERFSITSTHMVPTHFQRLLALPEEERAARDISSVTLLAHAGAPCPPEIKRQMLQWFGPVVWEYYGATEGSLSIASPDDALAKPGTVGRPLSYVGVKVMDSAGREVPPGEEGLVYFTMPTGPFSYHGDEAKTRASRIGDYATAGDIGWLDRDGYLFLADRREDLINSGGVNVYPAEVEHRLLEHQAVADVAVIGQPDQEWGQRIVAFVTTVPGTAEGPELAAELQAHCRAGIAHLKCPRVIYFRENLPRTETGKLLRRVLRAEITETAAKEERHAMSVNPAIIGREFGPVERSWTERDVMLYALGVGAGAADPQQELNLTTENSRDVRLQVLPTFAVLMTTNWPPLRDMGDFSLSQVLHAEQAVRLMADLPASGAARVRSRVTAVDDKGSAAVIRVESRIETPAGDLLAVAEQALYIRGGGGFGGGRGSSPSWARPEREPDGEVTFTTRPDQALLYRLSGDTNPLHSDPSSARDSGFERPILHGLCAYGIVGRLLTRELCAGDTSRVGEIRTRFSSPVFPGDTLAVRYWRTAEGALFQCLAGAQIVLDRGVFLSRSPEPHAALARRARAIGDT